MTTAAEFLGARPGEDGTWSFALGQDLHGAFGGAFGGVVAAASVMAARPATESRRPISLHTTFVRGLSTPTCRSTVELVNRGRTITTVSVDLLDETGKLAARSAVTFAADEALDARDVPAPSTPELRPYEDGEPAPAIAPIVEALEARFVGKRNGGYAHAVRIPWDAADGDASAEAICLAADFCVGTPVGVAMRDDPVPIPNPDLSVRFLGSGVPPVLVGIGRLGRIDRGVAATFVEVWGGDELVGAGLSSAVMLGGG